MKVHLVLYQPEIPQNTGNIMRLCAGTDTILHLIKPLGFKLEAKYLKREAVNYLESVKYFVYESLEDFFKQNQGEFFYITRYGNKTPSAVNFYQLTRDIYLIFGRESTGLPKVLLKENKERLIRLPTNDKIRSLNLANTAAIMLYEVLRQLDYLNLAKEEPVTLKGPNYLFEEKEEAK